MRGYIWAAVLAVVLCGIAVGPAVGDLTERVSVSTSGEQANEVCADNGGFAISADGRYVAFTADATNLVPGDTNGCRDIFVRDRLLGITERVSVGSTGEEGNARSYKVAISRDGRFVAFWSEASNLVAGDTNEWGDVLVRDRLLGTTERANVSNEGLQANLPGYLLKFSADGRYVVFSSCADNLVPGDTNGQADIFLRDLFLGTIERVTLTASGEQVSACSNGLDISADCRYIVFGTLAPNVVPGITEGPQIWLRDRATDNLELINLNDAGERAQFEGTSFPISDDGRYVAFRSSDPMLTPENHSRLTQVYVRDRSTQRTELVSVSTTGAIADDHCWDVALSADGRLVVFTSTAPDLVPGGNPYHWLQVFVRDRETGVTAIVSVGEGSDTLAWCEGYAAVSADGAYVLFSSSAPNLAPPDENVFPDVFTRRLRGRFRDVPTYHWAYPSVEACSNAGIVRGYWDGSYHPAEQVERAQMAVYLARALAGGDGAVPPHVSPPTFPDVPVSNWAFRHVEYCYDQGVVSGYWDGYHPDEVVNRAQMAVFVARAMAGGEANVPDDPDQTAFFTDVSGTHWAYKYVEYCHDQGVVAGYWDGYHPDESVTRAQMAVYVQRAFDLPM